MNLFLECFVLASIIEVLTTDKEYVQLEDGIKRGSIYMSYTSIYEDVRNVADWMHSVSLFLVNNF